MPAVSINNQPKQSAASLNLRTCNGHQISSSCGGVPCLMAVKALLQSMPPSAVNPAAAVQYWCYLTCCITVASTIHRMTPSATCHSVFRPAARTFPGHSVISTTIGATTAIAIMCDLRPWRDSCVNFVCTVRGGCHLWGGATVPQWHT